MNELKITTLICFLAISAKLKEIRGSDHADSNYYFAHHYPNLKRDLALRIDDSIFRAAMKGIERPINWTSLKQRGYIVEDYFKRVKQ